MHSVQYAPQHPSVVVSSLCCTWRGIGIEGWSLSKPDRPEPPHDMDREGLCRGMGVWSRLLMVPGTHEPPREGQLVEGYGGSEWVPLNAGYTRGPK